MQTPLETSLDTVQLQPSYRIPIVLLAVGMATVWVQVWVGGAIALMGFFLLSQTILLRLHFTAENLDIYRGKTLIRRFPYQDWLHWQIFWPSVPIIFYFREVNSIHLLPILFDPTSLRNCLEERCPRIDR